MKNLIELIDPFKPSCYVTHHVQYLLCYRQAKSLLTLQCILHIINTIVKSGSDVMFVAQIYAAHLFVFFLKAEEASEALI